VDLGGGWIGVGIGGGLGRGIGWRLGIAGTGGVGGIRVGVGRGRGIGGVCVRGIGEVGGIRRGGAVGGIGVGGGSFGFVVFAGQEFEVALFVLFPFPALVEDGAEGNDQEEGDEKDHGVEVGAVGFHFGAFVPAGGEADYGRYDDQEAEGDTDEELAEYLFLLEAVGFPVFNEPCFFFAQHGAKVVGRETIMVRRWVVRRISWFKGGL